MSRKCIQGTSTTHKLESGCVSSTTNPRSTDNVHADSATLIPRDLGKQVKKITQNSEMLLFFMFKQNDT